MRRLSCESHENVNTKCRQKTKQNKTLSQLKKHATQKVTTFLQSDKAGGGGMKSLSADPTETLNGIQPR